MLREYRAHADGLPDLLNFAALVAEGVLLGKDGSFTAGWWYAGPDMEAASADELAVLSSQVNAALLRLGNGWMLEANAMRRPAGGYAPPGAFPDSVTALIDEERYALKALRGDFEAVPSIHSTEDRKDITRLEDEGGVVTESTRAKPDVQDAARQAVSAARE